MHPYEPASRNVSEPLGDAAPVRTAEPPSGYRSGPLTTGLATLNPLQQWVADDLLGIDRERPIADLAWAPEIRAWIDNALKEHSPHVGRRQLWITKSGIAGALGCEARHLATKDDFAWTRAIAKGVVVHHAVALAAAGSTAGPRDLAYAALDDASEQGGATLRAWLRGLSEQERVALAGEAIVGIDGFLAAFPPLDANWNPVAEFPLRATIADGKVRVSGRADLAFGLPRTGADHLIRRNRMFVEIKTGEPRPEHRAEHLTYALLELLRAGVAPWRSATYYTASSTWVADDITLDLLVLAGKRLIDATKRLIELNGGREPTRHPGWRCGYCPLVNACPESGVEGNTAGDSDDDG